MADDLRVRITWVNDEASLNAVVARANAVIGSVRGNVGNLGGPTGTPTLSSSAAQVAAYASNSTKAAMTAATGKSYASGPSAVPPVSPTASSPQPRAADPAGRSSGGRMSGILGYFGRSIMVREAFNAFGSLGQSIQQEQGVSDLNRRLGAGIGSFNAFDSRLRATGVGVGASYDQMISGTNQFGSMVGRGSGGDQQLLGNVSRQFQLAKGLGIGQDALASLQGSQGQAMNGGNTDFNRLSAALALGVANGMRGREDELIKEIQNLTATVSTRLPTLSENQSLTMQSLIATMNNSGNQGLMGSRGAAVLGQVDSALQGNGSPSQQAILMNSLYAQSVREGKPMGALDLAYSSEEGISSAFNLRALSGMSKNMIGSMGSRVGTAVAGATIGLNQHQSEAFFPAFSQFSQDPTKMQMFADTMGKYRGLNGAALPFEAQLAAGGNIKNILGDVGSMISGPRGDEFKKAAGGVSTTQQAMDLVGQFGGDIKDLTTEQDKATDAVAANTRAMADLGKTISPLLTGSLSVLTHEIQLVAMVLGPLQGIMGIVGKLGTVFLEGKAATSLFGMPSVKGIAGAVEDAATTPGGGLTAVKSGVAAGLISAAPAIAVAAAAALTAIALKQTYDVATMQGAGLKDISPGDNLGLLGESFFGGSNITGQIQSRAQAAKNALPPTSSNNPFMPGSSTATVNIVSDGKTQQLHLQDGKWVGNDNLQVSAFHPVGGT